MSRKIKAFASVQAPVVIAVQNKNASVELASYVDNSNNTTILTNANIKNFQPFSPISGELLTVLSSDTVSFDKNDIAALTTVATCPNCGSHLMATEELASELKGERLHCVVCNEEVDVNEEDEPETEEADEEDVTEVKEVVESEAETNNDSELPETTETEEDVEVEADAEEDDIEINEDEDEVEEEESDTDEESEEDEIDETEEAETEENPEEEVEKTEKQEEEEVEAESTNVDQEEVDEENEVESSEDADDEELADEENANSDDEESHEESDDTENASEEETEEEESDEFDEDLTASVKKRISLNLFDKVDTKSSVIELIKTDSKYYVLCNSKPVATLNKEFASANVQSFFDNEANVRAALNASLDNGFTKEVCANFGLKPITISFRASKAVRQELAKIKSDLAIKAQANVENYKERFIQSLSIASVGVNKSIYGSNVLRDSLAKQCTLAGMVDAEDVVNDLFAKYGEDYLKEIIEKAKELVEKSDDIRNNEASLVANASFNNTVSKQVARRLGGHMPVESRVIEPETKQTNNYSKLF